MNISPRTAPSQNLPVTSAGHVVDVIGLSYDDRSSVLPALADALSLCGCWLLDRRNLSLTRMEYQFEVSLGHVFDLYSALVGSGIDLTRNSHRDLTSLCSLRKFNQFSAGLRAPGRVATVRLEVQFVDEFLEPQPRSGGHA